MPREVSNEGVKKQMENNEHFQSNSSSHIEVKPFQRQGASPHETANRLEFSPFAFALTDFQPGELRELSGLERALVE